ncbi:hypothetical protein HDV62DRAFT_377553 [Trichoderma sp. SZMC 28011]
MARFVDGPQSQNPETRIGSQSRDADAAGSQMLEQEPPPPASGGYPEAPFHHGRQRQKRSGTQMRQGPKCRAVQAALSISCLRGRARTVSEKIWSFAHDWPDAIAKEPMRLCLIDLFWLLHSGNHWLPRSRANQTPYGHFSINTPQLAEATNTIRMEATLLDGDGFDATVCLPSQGKHPALRETDDGFSLDRIHPHQKASAFSWQLTKQIRVAKGAMRSPRDDSRDYNCYQNPSSTKEGSWPIPKRRRLHAGTRPVRMLRRL